MLWDLFGDMAGPGILVSSWFEMCQGYFVEYLLAKDFCSAREKILGQYVSFLKRLGKSVSKEVRVLRSIAIHDVRSFTGNNCHNLAKEFSTDPLRVSAGQLHRTYSHYDVPAEDTWRISMLDTMLKQRYEMSACGEDLDTLAGLIESLCST